MIIIRYRRAKPYCTAGVSFDVDSLTCFPYIWRAFWVQPTFDGDNVPSSWYRSAKHNLEEKCYHARQNAILTLPMRGATKLKPFSFWFHARRCWYMHVDSGSLYRFSLWWGYRYNTVPGRLMFSQHLAGLVSDLHTQRHYSHINDYNFKNVIKVLKACNAKEFSSSWKALNRYILVRIWAWYWLRAFTGPPRRICLCYWWKRKHWPTAAPDGRYHFRCVFSDFQELDTFQYGQ